MTPYELWFSKKPKLSFLKVWGCDACEKKFHPGKVKPKLEKCIFIEYPKGNCWVHLLPQKPVPVIITPISEEVNDDDHETSD